MSVDRRSRSPLDSAFGPLEIRVLDAIWARRAAVCVRDLQPDFPCVAYTTLMTTLDRLFRKRALLRAKRGRAFYYRPAVSRDQLLSEVAGSAIATLLPGDVAAVRPILSMFVDTVERCDRALLDELESLVKARRQALTQKDHT